MWANFGGSNQPDDEDKNSSHSSAGQSNGFANAWG